MLLPRPTKVIFLQLLRIGYQLDATAEMYLATITTEKERTAGLMRLTVPQVISLSCNLCHRIIFETNWVKTWYRIAGRDMSYQISFQALAMFFGPMFASQIAIHSNLRISQFACGILLLLTLTPVIYYVLPQTHSVPKMATARLRPQVI